MMLNPKLTLLIQNLQEVRIKKKVSLIRQVRKVGRSQIKNLIISLESRKKKYLSYIGKESL